MEIDCESLGKCGFFNKYQSTKSLACKGFIQQYCKGTKQNICKRKTYRMEHGQPPSDDMMPSGQIINSNICA